MAETVEMAIPYSENEKTDAKSTGCEGPPAKKKNGLSILTAAIFITGELAGSGVLALPKAVSNTGWTGVALIIIFCSISGYCGMLLGHCWTILEERWPEYRGQIRHPYPAIGYRALGKWGRVLVSTCVDITQFGVGTIFLLLSAQLVEDILKDVFPSVSFCEWTLVLAVCLWPLMWLGTPNDFWPVAVGALLTTFVGCVLIVVQLSRDYPEVSQNATFPSPTTKGFFLAFGTIVFSFGGAACFPTIQNDMKQRNKFPVSVVIGFIGILSMYLPLAVGGYLTFGANVRTNLLLSLSSGMVVMVVDILLAVHIFFAYIIGINPFCQDVEDLLNIPFGFNWKRCALRTVVILMITFVAETVPHFGKILDLIGGSTVTLLAFVFPPIFYMKLCDMKSADWPERNISFHERVCMWELILLGIIGGATSTYNAILEIIISSTFSPPCYLRK